MTPNIILDALPDTIEVDGRAFSVNADFRNFIRFEKVVEDPDITDREKANKIMGLFFVNEKPRNIAEAIDGILYLYRCGNPPAPERKRTKNGDVEIKQQMIYSFEHDGPYIFAAFLSEYHIDLNEIPFLHWWKFYALFKSLRDDCKIVQIMSYRATNLSQIKDKNERSRIAKLKKLYALPDNLTYEDKVARAGAAFGGFL